jgi:hypothetical protein
MAILFIDGFDHYATGDILSKWTSGAATVGAFGRNSGSGLHNVGTALSKTLTSASGATIVFGLAMKFNSISSQTIADWRDAGTLQGSVKLNADGTISVLTGAATVLATSTWVASSGVWYYIEAKVVIDNATGSCIVRIDGTNIINKAASDTQSSANATWNQFEIGSGTADIDDLYVLDATGTLNNDFLGDSRVESLLPQTDAVAAGTNHGLTCSTGTDHGALVDESTPNEDTDYVSGSTANLKDTFNFPNMASSGTVKAVQVLIRARKTDQGTKTIRPVVRSGGTDFAGTTVTPAVSYVYQAQIYETDPNTSIPWTTAGVNTAEAGMQIVS